MTSLAFADYWNGSYRSTTTGALVCKLLDVRTTGKGSFIFSKVMAGHGILLLFLENNGSPENVRVEIETVVRPL